jgi:eukaryotic-like serine/threonine-protein kinase
MKGLAREPDDRFATAREMAEELVHVVPPAFATAVSGWVEEVAHEPLALRATMLAEIESGSTSVKRVASNAGHPEDTPTLAVPSMDIEPSGLRADSRLRRTIGLVGMVGMGVVVAGVSLARRGLPSPGSGAPSATASAPAPMASAPPIASDSVPPPVASVANGIPLPRNAAGTAVPAGARQRTPARQGSSPAPAGSIRYAQPD